MTVDARMDDPVTERRIEAHSDLDLRGTRELVELINDADAAECPSTFGIEPDRVLAVVAVEEAHEDDIEAGAAAVTNARVGRDDAVVALSASGRTPWVLGAVQAARAEGA